MNIGVADEMKCNTYPPWYWIISNAFDRERWVKFKGGFYSICFYFSQIGCDSLEYERRGTFVALRKVISKQLAGVLRVQF